MVKALQAGHDPAERADLGKYSADSDGPERIGLRFDLFHPALAVFEQGSAAVWVCLVWLAYARGVDPAEPSISRGRLPGRGYGRSLRPSPGRRT